MALSRSQLLALPAALALAILSASAVSQGYWLKDAPITHMTKEDRAIADGVIKSALDEGKDGQAYKWNNPKTGATGSITPGAPFERDGKTCRKAQFMNSAGGRTNESAWTLCKLPEGWKAVD